MRLVNAVKRRLTTRAVVAGLLMAAACSPAGAAFELRAVDARAVALCAEALTPLRGIALPERPGGTEWQVAVSSGGPHGLSGVSAQAVRVAGSGQRGGLRAALGRLGSPLYEERSIGLGVSWSPDSETWLLCDVRGLNLRAAGHDVWTGAIDIAVCTVVLGRLAAGVSIENAGRSRLLSSDLPVVHVLGFRLCTDRATFVAGTEIEAGFDPATSLGCEVVVTDRLTGRFGLGFDPARAAAGFGVVVAGTDVDAAWQWHPLLGVSTRVSVSRSF